MDFGLYLRTYSRSAVLMSPSFGHPVLSEWGGGSNPRLHQHPLPYCNLAQRTRHDIMPQDAQFEAAAPRPLYIDCDICRIQSRPPTASGLLGGIEGALDVILPPARRLDYLSSSTAVGRGLVICRHNIHRKKVYGHVMVATDVRSTGWPGAWRWRQFHIWQCGLRLITGRR